MLFVLQHIKFFCLFSAPQASEARVIFFMPASLAPPAASLAVRSTLTALLLVGIVVVCVALYRQAEHYDSADRMAPNERAVGSIVSMADDSPDSKHKPSLVQQTQCGVTDFGPNVLCNNATSHPMSHTYVDRFVMGQPIDIQQKGNDATKTASLVLAKAEEGAPEPELRQP